MEQSRRRNYRILHHSRSGCGKEKRGKLRTQRFLVNFVFGLTFLGHEDFLSLAAGKSPRGDSLHVALLCSKRSSPYCGNQRTPEKF